MIPFTLVDSEPSGPGDNRPPGHPPAPPKPPSDAAVLGQALDALVALTAIAARDPLFRASRTSLDMGDPAYRLRYHLGRALLAAREMAGPNLPARRVPTAGPPVGLGSTPSRPSSSGQRGRGRGCSDGTVRPPADTGECLVPGSGTAVHPFPAVTEIRGALLRPEEGAQPPAATGDGPVLGLVDGTRALVSDRASAGGSDRSVDPVAGTGAGVGSPRSDPGATNDRPVRS